MTNISAMKAIAELNKLQELRNSQPQPQEQTLKNNQPNSVFTAGAANKTQPADIDNQIIAKQKEINDAKAAE